MTSSHSSPEGTTALLQLLDLSRKVLHGIPQGLQGLDALTERPMPSSISFCRR